ncbi:hypothetical protein Tsubulata_043552, partial [Turnera subulata]
MLKVEAAERGLAVTRLTANVQMQAQVERAQLGGDLQNADARVRQAVTEFWHVEDQRNALEQSVPALGDTVRAAEDAFRAQARAKTERARARIEELTQVQANYTRRAEATERLTAATSACFRG